MSDQWKEEALAYIEREHSDERVNYLRRINPRISEMRYEFQEYRTPGGVLVESVTRDDGYVERWRMTHGDVIVTNGIDISLADVELSVSGHEWETYGTVPGWPHEKRAF